MSDLLALHIDNSSQGCLGRTAAASHFLSEFSIQMPCYQKRKKSLRIFRTQWKNC